MALIKVEGTSYMNSYDIIIQYDSDLSWIEIDDRC